MNKNETKDIGHRSKSRRRRNGESGVALVEVLVAVLILGVGLLGVAALQAMSSQMTNNAEQRTQAVLLAGDMLERIRANSAQDDGASYAGINVAPGAACVQNWQPAGGNVAANDISEWSNLLACLLPEASGTVAVNPGTRLVVVTIDWARQDAGGQPVVVRTVI
jgi:type IV pilus assembly protein PilV